ncbi:MAG: hypothetical protein ACW98X_22540, partial [Promethearchaeota archaeon]
EKYRENVLKPIFKGELDYQHDTFEENIKGRLELYEELKPDGQYIIFADVAEGLEKGDYSVAKVFDYETYNQVCEWHGHIEHSIFGSVMASLGRIYNMATLVVESNNHGHSSLTQIKNVEKYPDTQIFEHNVLNREKVDDDFKDPEKRAGWRTTNKTRPLIINCLASLILQQVISQFSEGDIEELESFVINANGKAEAEENFYDDRVMVLCIAYYLLTNDTFLVFYPFRKRLESEHCGTCHYLKRKLMDDNFGYCSYTRRKKTSNNFCPLFKEIDWDDI